MSDTRKCARCGGEEFQMRADSGTVIQWRDPDGDLQTWFCPNCDWGQNASERDS
ncbi:MAG: hypothetical protein AAFQ82_23460 [Myxococcota bacterium]